jgi:hypothetical protein
MSGIATVGGLKDAVPYLFHYVYGLTTGYLISHLVILHHISITVMC